MHIPLPSIKFSVHLHLHLHPLLTVPEVSKNMLSKKMGSMKKLVEKVKVIGSDNREPSHSQCLLSDKEDQGSSSSTPTGFFALYVGEERERFVIQTGYLSHPLFKMLLEKAYNEFGFKQRNRLVVPCSVTVFQEVVSAVESCNGKFDFGNWVDEFV
ncbi:unnamed protein product [Ilex paraguariensis]